MNRTALNYILGGAAVAAALTVSACAAAKRAPEPAPSKPAPAVSLAAAPSPAAAPPPALIAMPTVPLTRVGGAFVSADPAARTITIKDSRGRVRTFRVAGDARVDKGGAEAAIRLDAVVAGDRVRLKVGGDVVASVHVLVAP